MPSGLPNAEKARMRQLFAEGKVGRKELLEAESASYHSAGTCTFYGTANSNQMLLEIMGLQLPGSSFVNPGTELRDRLTEHASKQILEYTAAGNDYRPIGEVMDEKAEVLDAQADMAEEAGAAGEAAALEQQAEDLEDTADDI